MHDHVGNNNSSAILGLSRYSLFCADGTLNPFHSLTQQFSATGPIEIDIVCKNGGNYRFETYTTPSTYNYIPYQLPSARGWVCLLALFEL